jgi:hypothetical protein
VLAETVHSKRIVTATELFLVRGNSLLQYRLWKEMNVNTSGNWKLVIEYVACKKYTTKNIDIPSDNYSVGSKRETRNYHLASFVGFRNF